MNESAFDESFAGSGGDDLLQAAVEHSSDGLFALDGSGTVIFANPAVEDVLGYSPSELVGHRLSSLVSERSPSHRAVVEVVREGKTDLKTVEVPVCPADGGERWVAISMHPHKYDGQEVVIGAVRDVSERKSREGELERYERILETIDDGVYILDSNFNITHVNEAMASMVGYSREELVGSHSTLLVGDDIIEEAAELSLELLESRRDSATLTTELRTADGDTLPIETRFSLYPFDGENHGQVGVVRDITERKAFEETLTALHDSTRELLSVETVSEVCEVVADAATEVIDLSAAAVYLFDRDENVLRPVELSGDTADDPSSVPEIGPSDGVAWRAFVEDDPTVVDEADDRDWTADGNLVVPFGDHGVIAVSPTGTGPFTDDTRSLVGLLAANTEAALSRVEREIALRDRDEMLQSQNQRLRQLARVNAIIREIDQALVQADTLEDITNEVCERLVSSDRFSFAWIGEVDSRSDELRPRAWAGDGRGYLDEVSLAVGDETTEPAPRTAIDREPTVVPNVAADFRAESWRKAALSWDFRSTVAVPLLHGDYLYGVLTVYSDRQIVDDETVQAVFGELGETIANAMNAVETKRALLTDSRVELEFHLPHPDDPLSRLAREADCRIRSNGVVLQSDGTLRVFFTATGAEPEDVRSIAEDSFAIDAVRLVAERDDSSLFETVVAEPTVAEMFADHGVEIHSRASDADGMHVIVEHPKDRSVRDFVEMVQERYPDAELVGRRDVEWPKQTSLEFRSEFEERLTDRQLEILRVAYHSGFFAWPRETTGQEIAESLGVSQPTVNRHLRACERKLFAMLLEDG